MDDFVVIYTHIDDCLVSAVVDVINKENSSDYIHNCSHDYSVVDERHSSLIEDLPPLRSGAKKMKNVKDIVASRHKHTMK